MANFKIGIKTTVAQLKKQFRDEVGGELRVYDGGRKADDSDILVSLGATKGTLECRTSRTVGKFEEAMLKERNLKVKVFTKDDWVKVLDGITLSKVADIPRQAKKADMESLMSYQRGNAEANEADVAEAVSVPAELVGMPIIDITLDSADIFHNYEEELENSGRFSWPAIAVLIYDTENGGTWVKSSTTDTDETMIAAREWIEEEYDRIFLCDSLEEVSETMAYYQSTSCNVYGINDVAKDSDELYSAIGVALNLLFNGDASARHSNWYFWHLEAGKVLFRVRNNGWDHTEIFIATSDEEYEPVDCTSEQVDELIRRYTGEASDAKTGQANKGTFFTYACGCGDDLAMVHRDDKAFLIGKTGKQVAALKRKYNYISDFCDGLAKVELDDKYGCIDKSGKEVVEMKYDNMYSFREGLAKVELDGKYGFIDKSGKVVVKPKYDDACDFREGLAVVELDGKYGFINKSGKEIVKPKYEDAHDFREGLAAVELGRKYGFIDKSGKEVVKHKFDYVCDFQDGLVQVELDGKWGYIDKSWKEVVKPKYDRVNYFQDGLAWVELDGKRGFIDKTGKEIVKPKYEHHYRDDNFKDDLAVVKLNGKFGYISKSGKEVVKPKYDDTFGFVNGVAKVKMNGKYGFIDKSGKEIIKPKYDDTAYGFYEGLAQVELDDKQGFIDKSGKEIVKPKYYHAGDFSEGLAQVKLDDKYGLIDKSGKEIVKPKYDSMNHFSEGLAKVELDGKYGYIDKTGIEVIRPIYDAFNPGFSDGVKAAQLGGKWCFIDKTGKFAF